MIELDNVNISSGAFQLESVSMHIPAGTFAVLMGPTGIGKTTILEAICGLRPVRSGRILVHNQDVTKWRPCDRNLGYVPQDLALFPELTVYDQLAFALRLRSISKPKTDARVVQLARQMQIEPLLSRSVSALSGGERQRVALGRAISFQPQVLLLDEPFSALDEKTRQQMHALLKTVTEANSMTTLHVTHSEEEACTLAELRLVLQEGQIVSVPNKGIALDPDGDHQ